MIKKLPHIYSGGRLFIAALALLLAASTNTQAQCTPPSILSKTDSFRCGPGTVVLKATPSSGSISWYAAATGGTALGTGNTFTTPSLAANTTYYAAAVASPGCESTRQPVLAAVRPVPTVNIGNDTTICPNITYTLNATTTGATYAWNTGATTASINVTTAGTYSVLITVNGCGGSDARVITAGTVPVNTLPATTNLCAGETANLNAGNTGSTFLWTPGGATTQTINVTTGGSYQAKVTSVHGCIVNSTTNVVIRPLPVATLGNDTSICEGDQITLDAGNAGYSYDWSTGAATQTIQVSDSAIYEVTITTPYGCTFTEDKKITFYPSPRVEGFSFVPQFYEAMGTVKFRPLIPTNVVSYEWDFGDESPHSTQVNPTHVYAAGGDYIVTLTVVNGCSDYTLSQPINVDLTTGIVKLSKDAADVSLYPNPATEFIRIEQKNSDIRMEEVVVYNIVGSVLYRHQADNATQHQLSVATFAPGMYTISIRTNKGFVIRKFQVRP